MLKAELYSFENYKGHYLFVECVEYDTYYTKYEGLAQLNGSTLYHSVSHTSGDNAERKLKEMIDAS